MPDCTLHIGGPKTGSTAIQDALFFHLRDPRFQYVAGGEPNGTFALSALFEDFPHCEKIFRRFGSPGGRFAAYRARLERQWIRGLDRAVRNGTHLVISSELLWVLPQTSLERLRDSLISRGFQIHVRGYLRPWNAWLTSLCAHQFAHDRGRFALTSAWDDLSFQVQENTTRLWSVFGRDRVRLSLFQPAQFPQGCVVRDFASQVGLPVPPQFSLRSNDGFSRPAIQLAYCWHKFENPVQEDELAYPPGKFRLLGLVRQLPGPPLRFHPDLLAPWRDQQRPQDPWIERELGFSLADPPAKSPVQSPAERVIRREEDLFEFEPETLAWLARMTGQPVLRQQSGEQAAREVARQVSLLRFRPLTPREIRDGLILRLRKAWIRRRWGC